MKLIRYRGRTASVSMCLPALLLGVTANASSTQLLALHDAEGPTQLGALALNIGTLSVVSVQGYTARISFSGEVDGYFSTSGHYTDALCTVGPFRRAAEAIPGFVFRNGAFGVAYVPTEAASEAFTSGQQVFFVNDSNCEAGTIFEGGAYFLALQNDQSITGIRDALVPPLRLLPEKIGGSTCVFKDGFECSVEQLGGLP